jgi:hypothetical protein
VLATEEGLTAHRNAVETRFASPDVADRDR